MIRAFASLALACALATPALAVDQHIPTSPLCLNEADATAQVRAFLKAHEGASLDVIEGEQAEAWIDVFNTAIPPITDYEADKLWIVSNPKDDGDVATVAIFKDGRTCWSLHPSLQYLEMMRRVLRGN